MKMKRLLAAAFSALLVGTMILTNVVIPASADTSQELTGLYDTDNYTVKSNGSYTYEFDENAKTATCTGGQTKALLNYATELTDLEASATIASNVPATGLIYAGIGLFVQKENFSTTNFNGSEYLVYINRSANSQNKLNLVVRVTEGGKNKKEFKTTYDITGDTSLKIAMNVAVQAKNLRIDLAYTDGTAIASGILYKLEELDSAAGVTGYRSGGVSLVANGKHVFGDLRVVNKGAAITLPSDGEDPGDEDNAYKDYDITTNNQQLIGLYSDKNWTPYTPKADLITFNKKAGTIAFTNTQNKAYLNYTKTMTNLDASIDIKSNASGLIYGGLSFRIQPDTYDNAAFGSDGYSVVLVRSSNVGFDNFQIIVRHGTSSSASYNLYTKKTGVLDKDRTDYTLTLAVSVKNRDLVITVYNGTQQLAAVSYDLKTAFPDYAYYPSGAVGILTNGNMTFSNISITNTGTSITLPTEEGEEDEKGYTSARESNRVTQAMAGSIVKLTDMEAGQPIAGNGVTAYAKDFDNYIYYSSSSAGLKIADNMLISDNGSTHRAFLDGVTVGGFHAELAVKICKEGTLRIGMAFRVQEIAKDAKTLGTNDMEGYAAVLYKTPGNTGDHARVVICVYKYGKIDGKYTYLGTVGSKASTVPLTGYSDNVADAAGQELVLSVNVTGSELTACYYNRNNPSLISETMVVDLKNATDVEKNYPSYGNIYYEKGQIGIQMTGQGMVTGFAVSEPITPSTEVTDLSYLSSYTVYSGSGGVAEKDGYITATSAGTKKIMVNNLTVNDFTTSLDMTIDDNGNLSTGVLFRITEVGNANDATNGWALIARRNYSTMGEKNPKRIDLVLYKWGYLGGQLSYLGEVGREVYQGTTTFLDGKEAGTELTLVIKVEGSALDATLYRTSDMTQNVTFSSNLKFAADKENGEAAYNESGAIGIFMNNCVSDPLTTGKIRNFRVDDGSGVKIASGASASGTLVGPSVSLLSAENKGSGSGVKNTQGKVPGTGDYVKENMISVGLATGLAGIVIVAGILAKRKRR